MFKQAGISAAAVHGKMELEERRKVLRQFEEGAIRIITNCAVLTEGFDSPLVDSILLCRPTKSEGLYIQCVGRGTRVSPGKRDCLVMDFVDASKHSLCSFHNLEGAIAVQGEKREQPKPQQENRIEEAFTPPADTTFETSEVAEIDFFGRSRFSWLQVGDAWHLRISTNSDIWVRKSTNGYRAVLHDQGQMHSLSDRELPLEYAIGMAEEWVRNHTSSQLASKDASWRKDPPSPKQLLALQKMRIPTANLTKGDASDLIRGRFEGRNGSFAGRR